MGTRGYYVFKYNGIYYVFYNHFDSYYGGLGEDIVTELRKLTKEDYDEIKGALEKISERDMDEEDSWGGSSTFQGMKEAALHPEKYALQYVGENKPENDLFIEYIYMVNLDTDIFVVRHYDEQFKHPLREIPRAWVCAVGEEDE